MMNAVGVQNQDRVQALKVERDRYVSLAFCWADLLFEVDRGFNIVFAAGATAAFMGRNNVSLLGSSFRDIVAPVDGPLVGQALTAAMETGRIHDEVLRLIGADGNLLWVSMSANCLDTTEGHVYVGLRKATPTDKANSLAFPKGEGKLFDSGSFAELAASRLKKIQAAGETAEVTRVSIPGMAELKERLDAPAHKELDQSVGEFLRANSMGGDSAGKVADGRFSIMHAVGTDVDELMRCA